MRSCRWYEGQKDEVRGCQGHSQYATLQIQYIHICAYLVVWWCFWVYYESIKRKLNKRLILECRCDDRLKAKVEESTRLVYTV